MQGAAEIRRRKRRSGSGLLMYGVHVAWLVFYERDPDGPSS
jgi:hypothetical protein